jgi:hypothetical protein
MEDITDEILDIYREGNSPSPWRTGLAISLWMKFLEIPPRRDNTFVPPDVLHHHAFDDMNRFAYEHFPQVISTPNERRTILRFFLAKFRNRQSDAQHRGNAAIDDMIIHITELLQRVQDE